MQTAIAINGFGRVGRCLLRALIETGRNRDFRLVAINELADAQTIRYLTRYDSTHGRFPGQVDLDGETLLVNGEPVQLLHHQSISDLCWADLGVDLVLECTGSFSDRLTAEQHLLSGAKKVLFSQPADMNVDSTIVMGVNNSLLQSSHQIVSAASCTTNAVVPVLQILQSEFGIESAVIRTIHAAMHDQPVIDAYHHTDLRKTRAAFESLIPVETQLARGISRILPELDGKVEAKAMRVPVSDVSAIDLTVMLKNGVSAENLNALLKHSAKGKYKGILDFTDEPLASCDFVHDPHSGIIDAGQTTVAGGKLAKVLIWFDNEWGYANRMLDVSACWLGK
ncbi:MAG: type I glyceraldehyde-3-phosphate dehydrogenase [Porticoccaceae bacterium]